MTDGELNELELSLKQEVSAELMAGSGQLVQSHGYALSGTDDRIERYVMEVMTHPEAHNLYEQLAVRRFFRLLDIYRWNPSRVRRFFRFYEMIRFSGIHGRTRYRLTPVQCFQFASLFGHSSDDGRRLIRTAYLFVPRKFSKTTSAASLAVYDMLFGDANSEAYVGANSYDQAKICFDEIRSIMRDIDPSGRHFRINREKISYNSGIRGGIIQCLTANASTKDGLNASLVIMDEYAQARDTAGRGGADLKNTLTTSMGTRAEPLVLVITTASDVVDGPFAHELDGVKSVLRGEAENDEMFAHLFMPDVGDREDSPATWAKVQPHLGITVRDDYYAREWQNAQLSSENLTAFRTKLLNVFARSQSRLWMGRDTVCQLLHPFDVMSDAGGRDGAVAFDLSVHDDFSAVSYTWYNSQRRRFYCHTDYYFPEGALPHHPNEQLYRRWHNEGHLILCKGQTIDVRQVASDILRRSSQLRIIRIGYDSYKSQELRNILESTGASSVLTPFSQTYGSFNLPVESFEMLAYSTPPRIWVNDNPINSYCLGNCVMDTDNLGNRKPVKASQYRKIDGAITMLMTIGLLYTYKR